MSRHSTFCKHYRAMSEHATCEAGVAYDTFKGLPFSQRPCFREKGQSAPGGCEHAVFQTPEEEAARDAEMKKMFANMVAAEQAIVAFLGGPWNKGKPSAQGAIDCPACGLKGCLLFSRSGYNGHIHAHCKTANCVSWME